MFTSVWCVGKRYDICACVRLCELFASHIIVGSILSDFDRAALLSRLQTKKILVF